MGEDPPADMELVCPSCETDFVHEGERGRLPSVPCPECGEPVDLRGGGPQEEDEGGSGGGEASTPKAQVVETSAERDGEEGDESEDPDETGERKRTLMGVAPQSVAEEDSEADAEGEETDEQGRGFDRSRNVHDRETSVSREPLPDREPEEEGAEASSEDSSPKGGRLSDLKRRLEKARGSEPKEGSETNPFKDEQGNVGNEETRVAVDAGFDEEFDENDGGAGDAVEISVDDDEREGNDPAGPTGNEGSGIPAPSVGFGGDDGPEDPRDQEHRETKPAGEDAPLGVRNAAEQNDGEREVEQTEPEGTRDEAEADQTTEFEADGGIPTPGDVGGGEGDASEGGASVPDPGGLGGPEGDASRQPTEADEGRLAASSSVPRPDQIGAGESEAGGGEPTEDARETDYRDDPDIEEMSREMADEASDIIREMRQDGEFEADRSAGPPERAESPEPEVGSPSDDGGGKTPPLPETGGGEAASDAGGALEPSPEAAEMSGEKLPGPVAESSVEFPEAEPEKEEPSAAPASTPGGGSPELEPGDQETGRSNTLLVVGGLVAVLALAGAALVALDPFGMFAASEPAREPSREAKAAEKKRKQQRQKHKEAIASAQSTLHDATDVEVSDPELQRRVADDLLERGEPTAAARAYRVRWEPSEEDTDLASSYLEALVDAEHYRRARRVAVQAMGFAEDRSAFESTFAETLEADPALRDRDPVELDERAGIAEMGLGETVDYSGLVLRDEAGEPTGLWRPATGEEGPWRDAIAAWRLCQIVECQFEIPRTRPSRISRSRFEEVFDEKTGGSAPDEYHWVSEKGPDGEQREYLYGALREWPGELVRWPIEEFEVWRPWLSAGSDPELLGRPAAEAIGGFEDLGDGTLHDALVAESEGRSVRDVARRLSGIVTFDFLTNNWGRFEDDTADYGASNHFANGRFVTIETDTVFQRRKSTRIKGRFGWISRFSRGTIRSIRLLERDRLREILYPDPTSIERAKYEIFWEQREAVLSRVEKLVDEHDRKDVLMFR